MKIDFGPHLVHRLTGEGVYGLSCHIYSIAAQFTFSYLAVKYVGAVGYGLYAAAFVVITAMVLVGSFCFEYKVVPLSHRLVKDGHANTVTVLMRSALFMNLVMAGCLALILWAFRTPLANTLRMGAVFEDTLTAILPLGIIVALRSTLCGGVSAAGKVRWVFLATMVLNRSGMIGALIIFFYLDKASLLMSHPALLAMAVAVGECGGLLFLFVRWKRLADSEGAFWLDKKIDWGLLRELLLTSLPPLFHNMGGYASTQINKLLVGMFRSSSQVGIFHIVTMMASVPFLPFQMFTRSFGPMASSLHQEKDLTGLRRLFQANAFITLAAGLALSSLLLFWGKHILRLYGEEFGNAYVPLLVMVSATILWIVPGSCGNTLYMLNKDRIFNLTTPLSMAANLLAAFILIPRFGMVGAAYSTAAANILRNTILAAYLYCQTGIHAFSRDVCGLLVRTGLVFVLYFVLYSQGFEQLAGGICTVLFALLMSGMVRSHITGILKGLIWKKEDRKEPESV